MPLRDHFHSPLDDFASWDGLHGQWPAMMVLSLAKLLPKGYVATPHVHLGTLAEVDVGALESGAASISRPQSSGDSMEEASGGVDATSWAPPQPTMTMATELPTADEYEVRVFDTRRGRRLVAAVEIVSPANKDRPDHRRAFVAKCAALIQQQVSVAIVDLVTGRRFNLYTELLDFLGESDAVFGANSPAIYAAACRAEKAAGGWKLDAWAYPLTLGQPLPTLPLWLNVGLVVPLELENTYEQTCEALQLT